MEQSGQVTVECAEGAAVVGFNAESIVAAAGIEQIAEYIRRYVTDKRPAALIIDFSGVRFFSSHMLGLLVDLWRRMKSCDGVLVVCGVNPQLARVFKITNLDRLFEFHSDRSSALAAVKAKK